MSCTDPWVIAQKTRDAAKEEENNYESSFAGIQEDNLLTVNNPGADNIIGISSDGIIAAAPQMEWVQNQLTIESVLACRGPDETCTEIFVRGATYLLIDNDGPEEMNPVVLQRQIVQLRKELDEAIELIPGPVAEDNTDTLTASDLVSLGNTGGISPMYAGCYYASPDMTPLMNLTCTYGMPDILGLYDKTDAEECKLVSQEEADYERAMSMIGK